MSVTIITLNIGTDRTEQTVDPDHLMWHLIMVYTVSHSSSTVEVISAGSKIDFLYPPTPPIVAGYYGFTLDVHVSARPSLSRRYVLPSIFHF